ncbi:unnamed protein product, partial [Closterium sp. NIES-54]
MPHSPMQGEPITLPCSRSRIGECRTRNSAPHALSVLFLQCRPAELHSSSACTTSAATAASAATTAIATMASPTALTFNAEGRAVDLTCGLTTCCSFFSVTLGMGHLTSAERAHFGQYKIAKSLYDSFVARYASPSIAALSRLMLPYLAAFATIADLITHLRTSDTRYRAALPTEDHFLSLCTTELTVDLQEERLAAAEKSILAVGASRGDRRAPFFEGCSPVPLLPSLASATAVDLVGAEEVEAASALVGGAATARARGARVVEGTVGAAVKAVEEAEGVAVEVGVVAGVGASVAAVGVVEAAAVAVEVAAAVVEVAAAVVLVEVEPRSMDSLVVASASSSCVPVRPRRPSSFVSGTQGVGGLGLWVPALSIFALAAIVGRH